MYSYSFKYIICPVFIIISVWFIIVVGFDIAPFGHFRVVHGEYNSHLESCSPIFKSWALLISGSVDIILSSILLALFIRPLVKLDSGMKINHFREEMSSRQLTIDVAKSKSTLHFDASHSQLPIDDRVGKLSNINHLSISTMNKTHPQGTDAQTPTEIVITPYNRNEQTLTPSKLYAKSTEPIHYNKTSHDQTLSPCDEESEFKNDNVNIENSIKYHALSVSTLKRLRSSSSHSSGNSSVASFITDAQTPTVDISSAEDLEDMELEALWKETETEAKMTTFICKYSAS